VVLAPGTALTIEDVREHFIRSGLARQKTGGDPDNVTIFGESGGAHAVATLLAVPAARGLFAQVISQSPAMGLVRDADAAAAFAARFAAILAADAADAAAAVKPSPARWWQPFIN
jgi:para-nitrobenzyl esterase